MPNLPSAETQKFAPPTAEALNTNADVGMSATARVNTVGSALDSTLAPIVPLIGPALGLGVAWFGLKAIIKGENPLK